jgi:hypothetical protein
MTKRTNPNNATFPARGRGRVTSISMPAEREEALIGGVVNDVVRVGDTVRRSTGPWTPSVHALLRHLQSVGFRYAPQVLGIDDQGREVLTYIAGRPSLRPWLPVLRSDAGLIEIGNTLRDLRSALNDFVPPADAVWRTEPAPGSSAMRHGDVGPWNMLWDGERLVGLIDWDCAEPAPPLWDLAQAAWYTVPLFRDEHHLHACGFDTKPDLRHRFHVLCEAGDADPSSVLDALANLQAVEQRRVAELGRAGVAPFAAFLARGDVAELDDEMAKLARQRSELLA